MLKIRQVKGIIVLAISTGFAHGATCVVDVMFVMDGGGSLRPSGFSSLISSVQGVATRYDAAIKPGEASIGAVVYSQTVSEPIVSLTSDDDSFNQALGTQTFPGSTNNIHLGLEAAADEFDASGRPGVLKRVVLITDGSSSNAQATSDASDILKNNDVEILVLAVGQNVDFGEMATIASNPDLVFPVESYASLETGEGIAEVGEIVFPECSCFVVPEPASASFLIFSLLCFARRKR